MQSNHPKRTSPKDIQPNTRLVNTLEAARILGCAPQTLRISRCTGTLFGRLAPDFLKIGRSVRYRIDRLDTWIAQIETTDIAS